MGTLDRYLDASFLVALLTVEPSSERADRYVRANREGLLVSNLAAAEFASAIARRVRTGEVTVAEAQADLSAFDAWLAQSAEQIDVAPADIAAGAAYLRRLDLTLRTPDAIHIAMAMRLGATLVTFDRRMATPGQALGLTVTTP